MNSSSSKSSSFVQMFSSLNLFKNPIFRHGDRRGGQMSEAKAGSTSQLMQQPRNGGRELPKINDAGHSRSMTNSTSSSRLGGGNQTQNNLAPSTTVGTLILSNDSTNGPNNEQNEFISMVEYEPPSDIDDELGYPAAQIIDYWRKKEEQDIQGYQFDPTLSYIPHRRYMVDWISEIGEELRLQPITVHSAISLLDQLCTMNEYDSKGWRLQAICCLSVAAKYEEAERNMPMVSEMGLAAEMRLTTSMVTHEEHKLAQSLGWIISRVTSMHFVGYYLHQGVTFPADQCQGRVLVAKVTRYMKKYVEFFANLCQQDYSFQRHKPSIIAAASILAARRALCVQPLWRTELEKLTRYTLSDIHECMDEVWKFYESMFPKHQPLRTNSSEATRGRS